jgi:queuine tRNA-ribosyltransferase
LLSWVNTWFYQDLMAAMQTAIAERWFAAFADEHRARLAAQEAADGPADLDPDSSRS